MAQFSIGDASVEGFRQIGRHWRLLLGWGFFTIVAFIGGLAIVFALATGLAVSGASNASALGSLLGGIIIGLALVMAILAVTAASWRLVLKPDDTHGFMRLQLRKDELRFAGLLVTMAVLWIVALIPAMAIESATGRPWSLLTVITLVAGWLIAAWLTLRFSFASALIVDKGRIGFAQSWRLTRGHQWVLLGMALLTLCLTALAAIAYNLVCAIIAIASMGFSGLQALIRPDMQQPGHLAFALFQAFLQILLSPLWSMIWIAPFAAAYRAFSAPEEDAGEA
jgi:hypothetical protein